MRDVLFSASTRHADALAAKADQAMTGQLVDVHAWRNAILSDCGPANAHERLVLTTVSMHMNANGGGAWPSQELIARRAGVGLRSVKRHLENAEKSHWLERRRTSIPGRKWLGTEYSAVVPADVYATLPSRPWETDPEWNRRANAAPNSGATVAPRNLSRDFPKTEHQVPNTARSGANGVEVGASRAQIGANQCTSQVPELGLLTPPLNSSYELSKEQLRECALTSTASTIATQVGREAPELDVRRPAQRRSATRRLESAGGFARESEPLPERLRKAAKAAPFLDLDKLQASFGLTAEQAASAKAPTINTWTPPPDDGDQPGTEAWQAFGAAL